MTRKQRLSSILLLLTFYFCSAFIADITERPITAPVGDFSWLLWHHAALVFVLIVQSALTCLWMELIIMDWLNGQKTPSLQNQWFSDKGSSQWLQTQNTPPPPPLPPRRVTTRFFDTLIHQFWQTINGSDSLHVPSLHIFPNLLPAKHSRQQISR